MAQHRLSDFLRSNTEPILQAWEDFARTVEPPALTMDDRALRDHAHQMLLAFATDLERPQSERERAAKSKGQVERGGKNTAAETHAEARLLAGYTVVQLVSEYRALRSSVLSLWGKEARGNSASDMEDMTRFNEAVDQALAESVDRYEQLVRQSRDMFLAILGHDLRNPLGTLVSGSSFLMQATDISSRYVLAATRMFNSAKRMSSLINDLIDFTRTRLGPGIPISVKQGDIVAICKQVVDELRTFHSERQIQLSVPPRLRAPLDEGRIGQLLSNLIGNAIQYGAPEAPVCVDVSEQSGNVVISVNNRGPAIPPDQFASIFDPLVRLEAGASHATPNSSLGIGLFIAREIARAHGGTIDVASDPESGTTFTVTIPGGGTA